MTKTYKGYALPEIVKEGQFFIILDEHVGWFEGWSEKAVLEKWQGSVTAKTYRAALDGDRYQEIEEGTLACLECGALVIEPFRHDLFHEKLTQSI